MGAQLVAGYLTVTGLVALRSRLDPGRREFDCGHSRCLLVAVIEELAPLRGMRAIEDDLYAVAIDDDRVWAGMTERLMPDTVDEIEWRRPPGRW